MPDKKRYGVYIKAGPINRKDTTFVSGEYIISIGEYGRNSLGKDEKLTTNPEISEVVEGINKEHKLKGKISVGRISFFIVKSNPTVVRLAAYQPFTSENSKISRVLRNRLVGHGLASRIELNILKDLQKKFPGCKVATRQISALHPRKMQLRKRGSNWIDPMGPPVSFQREILKIARYIGAHRKIA